jgi:DNA-binding NtrC family response regulator
MKHVLLLEDDDGISSVIIQLLEEENYYVSATASVGDACDVLERVKIDLFIADVLLPDGTALAALDAATLHKVPFILMTGCSVQMAHLESHGQFHLSKPFKLVDFLDAVRDRIGSGDGVGAEPSHRRGVALHPLTCAAAAEPPPPLKGEGVRRFQGRTGGE